MALITATLSSGACLVSSVNCSVFKTHLQGLSQTVTNTHRYLLFSNDYIDSHLNFAASSKPSLQFSSFLTVVIPVILLLFCLPIVEKNRTRYNHPDKRFLEVPQFSPSVHSSKNTLTTALLLMLKWFGMIYQIRSILLQFSPV